MPVIVDPSNTTDSTRLVRPMALAAAACDSDGLTITAHNDPSHALRAAEQSLRPNHYEEHANADGDDEYRHNADGNRTGALRAALGVAGVIVVDGGVGRVVSVRLRARAIVRCGSHVPLSSGTIRR